MSKLPEPRRLNPEDYPKQKDWMPQVSEIFNKFMVDVIRSLNRQLTVSDNFDGGLITVIIDGTFPLDVKFTGKSLPKVCWIGHCREVTGAHTTFTTPLFLDWEFTSTGLFRINNIAGLTASGSNKYTVTIVALAG